MKKKHLILICFILCVLVMVFIRVCIQTNNEKTNEDSKLQQKKNEYIQKEDAFEESIDINIENNEIFRESDLAK